MARRNAFLREMQAKHKQVSKTSIVLTEKWTRQAAMDALCLILGYGKCMGKRRWGATLIARAADEWVEKFLWVLRGLQGEPDSDAIRAEVDRLLKSKVPPERYGDWARRYPDFVAETIEEEKEPAAPQVEKGRHEHRRRHHRGPAAGSEGGLILWPRAA